MDIQPGDIALNIVNHIPGMVAYWDADQRCRFSNEAYRHWFGRTPAEMVGMFLKDLLGPLYVLNLPYIQGALRGERQEFERRIPLPQGGFRDSIATYTPDIENGTVRGFFVHVTDVTLLREREAALEQALRERDEMLAQVRELTGLLPVCAWCRKIKDDDGYWSQLEDYVARHSKASFTHGICPDCRAKLEAEEPV